MNYVWHFTFLNPLCKIHSFSLFLGFISGFLLSFKAIIEAAATAENEMMMSEYNGKSGAAFARLTNDHGVKVRAFNDDVWDAMAEAADEVFEEARAHSDLANRIHESFEKGLKDIGGWLGTTTGEYLNQRNRIRGI